MTLPGFATSLTGIDTNVLLRFILRDDPRQYPAAHDLFASLTEEHRGFITAVTLAETYWTLSRSMGLTRAECLAIFRGLIESPVIEFDDGEGVVRALTLAEEGADFADALIDGTMTMFGANQTVTFDRGAAKRLGWRLLEPTPV